MASRKAERLIQTMRSRVVQEAQALDSEFETEHVRLVSVRPDLSARLAGEARCLRTIIHTFLQPMAEQLA